MYSIDVALLTKDSYSPVFKWMLSSLYREVPINKLIVVDGYSRDSTLDYIRFFCKLNNIDYRIIMDKGNRATARQKAIEAVETKYFMFIDDDVILLPGWYTSMFKNIDNRVGMAWGVAIIDNEYDPTYWSIYRSLTRLYARDEVKMAIKWGGRGYTHDTIILKEAVEDIEIPEDLNVLEDWFIKQHVVSKGYKYLIVNDARAIHFYSPSLRKNYEVGRLGYKYGFYNWLSILRRIAQLTVIPPYIMLATRSYNAMKTKFALDYNLLRGMIGK